MKIVTTMPLLGQFLAVWKFEGQIWSSTVRWEDGALYVYLPFPGGYSLLDVGHPLFNHSIHFIILDDSDGITDISLVPEGETIH